MNISSSFATGVHDCACGRHSVPDSIIVCVIKLSMVEKVIKNCTYHQVVERIYCKNESFTEIIIYVVPIVTTCFLSCHVIVLTIALVGYRVIITLGNSNQKCVHIEKYRSFTQDILYICI